MANTQPNEVEEVMKGLKQNPGFASFILMNNDGIVIKFENMPYKTAVQHACLVLDLCAKAKKYVRELLEPPDNEVESLRLRTTNHEMIVAQREHYTMVVVQEPIQAEEEEEAKPAEGEEKKE